MKKLSIVMLGLVMLVVTGCAGGVGPTTVAPTVDITGRWVGTWVAVNAAPTFPLLHQGPSTVGGRLPFNGKIQMTLTQTGSQYSGNLLMTGTPTNPSGPTQGVVSGNQARVLQPTSLTGSLTVQGDTMSGELQGGVQGVIAATLTRQK